MKSPVAWRTVGLLWRTCTFRHWKHSPGTTLALTLILALGVAVFFSVRLANRSAISGFAQFSTTLTGDADLVLTSDAGRIPVSDLERIRKKLHRLPVYIVPVLEATASIPGSGKAEDDFDARQVEIAGVDLIAVQNLRYARGEAAHSVSALSAAGRPGSELSGHLYLTPQMAGELQVTAGETLQLFIADRPVPITVGAILGEGPRGGSIPARLLVMDLPALQRLTGRAGWIDRIELFVPEGSARDALPEIENLLGEWQVDSSGDRRASAMEMTAAFRANLTILSGLALLVGIYLIVQALEAAVVRRRPEIATLLSLGVDARTVRTAWLMEAATFGIAGSALGILIGYAGAQLAVQGVAQTVNALYLSTDASRASWHAGETVLAFALGLGASLMAGILPARDAAMTPPAHVLKQGTHSTGIRLLDRPRHGVLFLLAGTFLIQLPPVQWAGGTRFPLAGYGGAICWIIGMSVMAGATLPLVGRLLRRAGDFSAPLRIAVSQLRRPSGRHKLSVAGLVVAVSMAAGMGILIKSFEGTMQNWISRSLKADLFIACKGVQNASNRNRISEETWKDILQDPAVAAIDVGHFQRIRLRDAETLLVGARLGRGWSEERLIWLDRRDGPAGLSQQDPDGAWPAYVSESFSRRFGVSLDSDLHVPTPAGMQRVRIAGIFADYGNERGSILLDPDRVSLWFNDRSAVNVAAYLEPGADLEQARLRIAGAYPALAVRANATLRAEVLRIFRQTFSITHALKIIGVTVAVAGLVLSLISLLLERRHELATLKEVGMSSRQLRTAVVVEGSAVAGIGLAGGLLLSLALGYVLIFVINRQSFGWTLGFSIPWSGMAGLAVAVFATGAASAAAVGQWAARLRGEQEE